MKNSDAIQILKPFRDMMFDQHGCPISDAVFALDKAIEALEKTSGCKGCKQTQIHCFDCARNAPDFYKGEDDD